MTDRRLYLAWPACPACGRADLRFVADVRGLCSDAWACTRRAQARAERCRSCGDVGPVAGPAAGDLAGLCVACRH